MHGRPAGRIAPTSAPIKTQLPFPVLAFGSTFHYTSASPWKSSYLQLLWHTLPPFASFLLVSSKLPLSPCMPIYTLTVWKHERRTVLSLKLVHKSSCMLHVFYTSIESVLNYLALAVMSYVHCTGNRTEQWQAHLKNSRSTPQSWLTLETSNVSTFLYEHSYWHILELKL